MATPTLSIVKGSDTVPKNINPQTISQKIDSLNSDRYLIIEMANKFHSYLELDELIHAFREDIGAILGLDDVQYQQPEMESSFQIKGRHMISYQLVLHRKELGEIALFRRK